MSTGTISLVTGTLRAKLPHDVPRGREVTVAIGDQAAALMTMLGDLYSAQTGVTVRVQNAGPGAIDQLGWMSDHGNSDQAAESQSVDVFGADVAHMATLADGGHIRMFDDHRPIDLLDPPVDSCYAATGRAAAGYYGVPFYTNVGMLYRRDVAGEAVDLTGLLDARSGAKWIAHLTPDPGDHGEGLLCNFFEHVLAVPGCGALITEAGAFSNNLALWNRAVATIRAALNSGRLTPCVNDQAALGLFRSDEYDFMRNWPTLLHRSADDGQVTPAALAPLGGGILGGVNLAVARNTRDENGARDLIRFLTGPQAQRIVALYGYPPTLKSTYGDEIVRPVAGQLGVVKEAVKSARRRPAARDYRHFSAAVVTVVKRLLSDKESSMDQNDLAEWNRHL